MVMNVYYDEQWHNNTISIAENTFFSLPHLYSVDGQFSLLRQIFYRLICCEGRTIAGLCPKCYS